jgi:hypothetical protein
MSIFVMSIFMSSFFFAFPAKAGIQDNSACVTLDPRFRGEGE